MNRIALSLRPDVAQLRLRQGDRQMVELVFRTRDDETVIELPRHLVEELVDDYNGVLEAERAKKEADRQMSIFTRMGEPL